MTTAATLILQLIPLLPGAIVEIESLFEKVKGDLSETDAAAIKAALDEKKASLQSEIDTTDEVLENAEKL